MNKGLYFSPGLMCFMWPMRKEGPLYPKKINKQTKQNPNRDGNND